MILKAENILDFIPSGLKKFGKLAQIGVDLSICNITRIKGGKLYQNGKKDITKYENVESFLEEDENGDLVKTWKLPKGVYSLTFDQDIKLDNKHGAIIIGRSCTNRLGCLLRSAIFDSGFECPNIGATLYVMSDVDVEIQEGSRLAQLVVFDCEEAKLYNGDYKGKKDLK